MNQAAQASRISSARALQSQVAVIEQLGGELLTGSGFETEEPEAVFEERV
jgi:hypothetical protein